MKKIFAIISLFALVLTSCEKEEAIVIGSGLDTITATIESTTDTKATLQDGTNNNVVLWESYDPISVFIQQGNTVSNVKYVLNDGDGTTEGVFVKADPNFEIAADATILAAVYPYNEDAAYADGSNTAATYTDDCMATIYVSNENGNVTINGGNFYCVQQDQTTGYNHILNYKNSFGSNQKIFVKGGKFYRMNPAVGNGTEQTYLNAGYTSAETTENDIKVFTVSATENN